MADEDKTEKIDGRDDNAPNTGAWQAFWQRAGNRGRHPRLIEQEVLIELVASTTINIVCFRYSPRGMDRGARKALNIEIMLRLQEEGIAALSDTTVHGEHCLRVAITNHRTRRGDLEVLVEELLRLGALLAHQKLAMPGARVTTAGCLHHCWSDEAHRPSHDTKFAHTTLTAAGTSNRRREP